MPLITKRDDVLALYRDAACRGWVIPAFGVENLTTIEAVLSATKAHGERIGRADLPITLALTNLYQYRSQTANYTHTRQWEVGLKLFLADVGVLTASPSPFSGLNVMVHLDHVLHDADAALLSWDMAAFSSIMYDASTLPFEENMEATRRFVDERGAEIVIEGACDEIASAGDTKASELTTPERAATYAARTRVDFLVVNLGTEHRASASDLSYDGELARQIRSRVGRRLVLHGGSSVARDRIRTLADDGICKVNVWTALERDSSPALLSDMVQNAAKVAGRQTAKRLAEQGYLGHEADLRSSCDLAYCTTTYRQAIVFEQMKRLVADYLALWYV
jgi:fructose-bisphosphate aldolase class II